MRFVVVAHRCTETNEALAAVAEALGVAAAVLPPRDALRHVARVAQRRGRVHEALGLPVVRPVICGDFFQPRRFRRVELLTELCDCFE